jgi:hypothetical protein
MSVSFLIFFFKRLALSHFIWGGSTTRDGCSLSYYCGVYKTISPILEQCPLRLDMYYFYSVIL